ncbi:hypothetical protein NVS89_17340 [Ancylobacter sp. MQZ15Z-1]|uniref:Uncharacterized protein n=1 Tax=Ancylobacter mangrovi TaxID=2972472 RepID=A0A9X2T543_9HYPH|nr:hypothetical protein [Ancylobacter mangrovi]MCS0496866.1 hypothetical protein [Ancylobacter mangrovi]
MTDARLVCAALLPALALAACSSSSAVRTSSDTAIIQTSAAPVCRGSGAAQVAQKQAAIETIKAGYDRYIIVDARSANNVRMMETPGSVQTTGVVQGGFYNATSTYRPGVPVVYGTHDQAFAIRMFHNGEPGAEQAVPAREMLGENWADLVKAGRVNTCM